MGTFLLIVGAVLMFVLILGRPSVPKAPNGSFVVRGFKNGELVYQKTYENEFFIVGAGDKFDKVEITEK